MLELVIKVSEGRNVSLVSLSLSPKALSSLRCVLAHKGWAGKLSISATERYLDRDEAAFEH